MEGFEPPVQMTPSVNLLPMLTYLVIAFGLSMDAFVVSVSSGICIPDMKARYALRSALAFGLFQAFMPLIGWGLGGAFRGYIEGFDHWVAFGLLALVGGKMIYESFKIKDPTCDIEVYKGVMSLRNLLVLAVATSLDALAVGLSYSVLHKPILFPALLIGVVTFLVSLVGCEFGKRIGAKFERWAEIAGGLILLGIGGKILLEHLLA
ncbi:MAG: rane protein yebN [Holophagaceae bacterium]|nr:rane protein yebN [Holophagaceae bacterium]